MNEAYQINRFLKLKLIDGKTSVFVNNEKIAICKHVAVEFLEDDINKIRKIRSIDDLVRYSPKQIDIISPDQEFMVHCSNIQAWAENSYDTRLLHSNIAFPILKKLTKVGDISAKRIFKEEIAKRFISEKTR